MNERIRELEIEAANWARQNHRAVDPGNLTKEEYEQRVLIMTDKFAELIVKECMEVCKSRVGNSDYNTGRMHCVSDLKEHFGVE